MMLTRFWKDRQASVAPLPGIALIPLTAAVGTAVDYPASQRRPHRTPSRARYTIQVNTGGDLTSTLLQNCASSSDKFYLLTSASHNITAFTAIGTNLTRRRLAM